MVRYLLFSTLGAILILFPQYVSADAAPHQIAGFTLGEQISAFVDLVNMETSLPLRHSEFLRVVETRDIPGYKSGSIIFGNCADPGRIVRIKLKYDCASKKFYDDLLERFKERFGEPDKWRGDPFHTIICWKWAFRDKNDHRITLHFQHSMDKEHKFGNSIKLTNMTLMEKEHTCYEKEHLGSTDSKNQSCDDEKRRKEEDYQQFIPK
jgi:hypothetical protein